VVADTPRIGALHTVEGLRKLCRARILGIAVDVAPVATADALKLLALRPLLLPD
jgi:hypothetical protein